MPYGTTYDTGEWDYGWSGGWGWAYGYHFEEGWEVNSVDGWFYSVVEEYGWYHAGPLSSWGWHYDYGGWGWG